MSVQILPDLSFIDNARPMEVEAVDPGRRSNQITIEPVLVSADSPSGDEIDEAAQIMFSPAEDVQETEERLSWLNDYVPHATKAFKDRDLIYPFDLSTHGDSLKVRKGMEDLAQKCAELVEMRRKNGTPAQNFEKRAAKALHKFIGGWAVCVGAPRMEENLGPKKAVEKFRGMLTNECGPWLPTPWPPNGDFGADALWVLGRKWGGPIVFLQVKNSEYNPKDPPNEFLKISHVLSHWFGRPINQHRKVIPVLAVNTILTQELKEQAFACAEPSGFHLLDAVDIIYADALPNDFVQKRDLYTEF
jgi:hypothetical protein